jgi:hypothetical protein
MIKNKWIIYTFYAIYIFYILYYEYFNKKKNKIKLLTIPKTTELYIFDNGIGGLWYKCKNDIKNIILCFNGFQENVINAYENLKYFQNIFENYNIIYIENPTFNLSKHSFPIKNINDLGYKMYRVYECLLRYKKWNKIGFIGFDFGCISQGFIYNQCIKNKIQKPNWIIHCNGPKDCISYKNNNLPWHLNVNNTIQLKEMYKNIDIPIYIIHCRNNAKISFLEAIILYDEIKTKAKLIMIYGIHESFLQSEENREIIKKEIIRII